MVHALQDTPGIIGLGGSSTIDMGLGFLHRIGATLLDEDGRAVEPTAHGLPRLHRIIVEPGRREICSALGLAAPSKPASDFRLRTSLAPMCASGQAWFRFFRAYL